MIYRDNFIKTFDEKLKHSCFIGNPFIFQTSTPTLLYDLRAGTTTGTGNSNIHAFGNRVLTGDALIGKTITRVGFELRNMTGGTITLGIWNNNSGTVVFTFGTITSTTSSYVLYERENLTGYTLSADQVIGAYITGVDTFDIQRYNTGTGASATINGNYWADSTSPNWQNAGDNQDMNMTVYGY